MSIDIPKNWLVVTQETLTEFLSKVNWKRDEFGFYVLVHNNERFATISSGKCYLSPECISHCEFCGSMTAVKLPCTACHGTGKSPLHKDQPCVCGGTGTHEAEFAGVKRGALEFFRDLKAIVETFQSFGYNCDGPKQIVPALKKLHEQCDDARDECVKLKKELRNKK